MNVTNDKIEELAKEFVQFYYQDCKIELKDLLINFAAALREEHIRNTASKSAEMIQKHFPEHA